VDVIRQKKKAKLNMKDLFKGKFVTILVVAATVILAGVAIFTALRLYQLRQESISLTQPESEPEATQPEINSCELLTFSITEPTPSLSPTNTLTPVPSQTLTPVPSVTTTPVPTSTPTNTPTPTQPPVGGISPTPTTIAQATPTPTTAYIAAASPTPGGAALPDAGIATPTLIIGLAGILLILAAFLLAF